MARTTVDRNVEIKDLPVVTEEILNTLHKMRGIKKKDLIREALIEYGENHKKDIVEMAKRYNNG